MSKDVKIVIGANYGDEGKGLMTRHFTLNGLKKSENPIVVFHNGTAQRGHTVDYTEDFRHVFHHFGSGTGDGAPTYFADTFLIHPMEFAREYMELWNQGVRPITYCDPRANVITPFDMLVDHMTEDYIALINGEREFGSCGFGSWCATDRIPHLSYSVKDFIIGLHQEFNFEYYMEKIWSECMAILIERGVDIEKLPKYKDYFSPTSEKKKNMIAHFKDDMQFFFKHTTLMDFDEIWKKSNYLIFENGQGLGLDQNVENEWHTTSNTGLVNPVAILGDRKFNAEVCYVTRSYLTRHGVGPLEEAVKKAEINGTMVDKTNVHNDFQGSLRYGYLEDDDQADRIIKDYSLVMGDKRFCFNTAVTHTNEFDCGNDVSKYYSDNKFTVTERK